MESEEDSVRNHGIGRSCLIFVALTLALSGFSVAEPEVTQGTPKEPPKKEKPENIFKSPMVMKTRLEAALPDRQDQWNSSSEFESYICDDVRLKLFESYVAVGKKAVVVTIYVTTYTEPGVDKQVDILMELMVSDRVIGTRMLGPFASEEKKEGYKRITLKVPVDQWPTEGVPSLRMTMNVVDDP
jgi:hypothetical protein